MKWGRIVLVIFGAVIITALGIDAADTLKGSQGTLLSRVISSDDSCPSGMVAVETIESISCVDAFEVSPDAECPNTQPNHLVQTQQNIATEECRAVSVKDGVPWRYITRDQAMQMCAREGKRLPSSSEWYRLSLGLINPEASCNVISDKIAKTGEYGACSVSTAIYDLIGNVWEWVSDDVIEGTYKQRNLPESGYVAQVDADGIATEVSSNTQTLFEGDYFWSQKTGSYGIIRGGFFDSGTDAGIYAVHADITPTSASAGIGFRCVR
jgi:formylglycine-generating enzyme required for sulfatase activity